MRSFSVFLLEDSLYIKGLILRVFSELWWQPEKQSYCTAGREITANKGCPWRTVHTVLHGEWYRVSHTPPDLDSQLKNKAKIMNIFKWRDWIFFSIWYLKKYSVIAKTCFQQWNILSIQVKDTVYCALSRYLAVYLSHLTLINFLSHFILTTTLHGRYCFYFLRRQ